MLKFLVAFMLCTISCFAYPTLWTGTYQLSGGNSKWEGSAYQGTVSIQPQGENYSVIWRVGNSQTQYGIGILYNGILSVAYVDSATRAWGVVSYRLVSNGELEGRWTTSDGTTQKPEYLVWIGY